MKLKIQSFIVFCMITSMSFAQIGIGTTSPNASSVLDMTSTTQGVLIPRMTTIQRETIATPAIGLQVYDTDTKSVWSYNGAAWADSAGGSGKFVDGAAADIAYYDGRVGIGINNFSTAHKLFVDGPKSDGGINTAARINALYTGTGTSTSTTAVAAVATNSTTGTISTAIGTQGIVENQNVGGTISFGVGSWQRVINSGSIDDASGFLSLIENTGTITRAYSQNIGIYNLNAQIDDGRASYLHLDNYGTMNDGYGLYIDYFGEGLGTITNSYALYITQYFNQGVTNNYAIYSASDADSYLEGNLEVNTDLNVVGNIGAGIASPQRKVHISEALRLEPQGTEPANGALGDLYTNTDGNLYFHDGANWRQVSLVP